jgi:hypothetical protein
MTTYCSFCSKQIKEDSEKNINKKYLCCSCNHGLTPKGSNNKKEVVKMEERKDVVLEKIIPIIKEKKEKKISISSQVRQLLSEGKTEDEIAASLNIKKKRVQDMKWVIKNKK